MNSSRIKERIVCALLGAFGALLFVFVGMELLFSSVVVSLSALVAIVLVAFLLCAVALGVWKAITKRMSRTTTPHVEECITKIGDIYTSITERDGKRLKNDLAEFGKTAVAIAGRFLLVRWVIGIIFTSVIVFAGYAGSVLLYRQNQLLTKQNEKIDRQNDRLEDQNKLVGNQNLTLEQQTRLVGAQNSLLNEQTEIAQKQSTLLDAQNTLLVEQNSLTETQNVLAEASRRSALVFELTSILESIESTLRNKETPKESETETKERLPKYLEGRIIALSRSFRPYRYVQESGNLTEKPLSPERGQLLVAITSAPIETERIFKFATFARADLSGANLRGLNLTHLDLRDANLVGADLSGSVLSGMNLSGADLRSADLRESDLRPNYDGDERIVSGADLRRANLRGAILVRARLGGANLSAADISNADLQSADFNYLEDNLQIDLSAEYPTLMRAAKLPRIDELFNQGLSVECSVRDANLKNAVLLDAYVPTSDWLDQCGAEVTPDKWSTEAIVLKLGDSAEVRVYRLIAS